MKLLYIRLLSTIVSFSIVLFVSFSSRNFPNEFKIFDFDQQCVDCHSEFPEQQFQIECKESDFHDLIGMNKDEIKYVPYGTKFVLDTTYIKSDEIKTLHIFLDKKEIVKKVACL